MILRGRRWRLGGGVGRDCPFPLTDCPRGVETWLTSATNLIGLQVESGCFWPIRCMIKDIWSLKSADLRAVPTRVWRLSRSRTPSFLSQFNCELLEKLSTFPQDRSVLCHRICPCGQWRRSCGSASTTPSHSCAVVGLLLVLPSGRRRKFCFWDDAAIGQAWQTGSPW